MTMKKIKPQYGKVVPPLVAADEKNVVSESERIETEIPNKKDEIKQARSSNSLAEEKEKPTEIVPEEQKKQVSPITADPNPFLQTKEVFSQANLTKIGYRMRTEYVEILDIIKKLKKGGYTLEAVLDDALTYYFENSEDGKDALVKAEIFYS